MVSRLKELTRARSFIILIFFLMLFSTFNIITFQLSQEMFLNDSGFDEPSLPGLPEEGDWSSPFRVTYNYRLDDFPSLIQRPDGSFLCTFHSERSGPSVTWELVSDDGLDWYNVRRVTQPQDTSIESSLTGLTNGTVFCATRRLEPYNRHLDLYKRVENTWSKVTYIIDGYNPSLIHLADDELLMAFESSQDIWMARIQLDVIITIDTWQVTSGPAYDRYPSLIQVQDGTYLLSFSSNREGDWAIFTASSPDALTWTINRATSPSLTDCGRNSLIQCRDGTLMMAFRANNASTFEDIFITDSVDGITWSTPNLVPLQSYDTKYQVSLIQRSDNGFSLAYTFLENIYIVHTKGAIQLDLSTEKTRYAHNEPIKITASAQFVNASPCIGFIVDFNMYFPNGTLYFSVGQITNLSGLANLELSLSSNPGGNYRVTATLATPNEGIAKGSVSFFYLFYYEELPTSINNVISYYSSENLFTNATINNYGSLTQQLVLYHTVFNPEGVPFTSQWLELNIPASDHVNCSFILDIGSPPIAGEYQVQLSLRTDFAENSGYCIDIADLVVNIP